MQRVPPPQGLSKSFRLLTLLTITILFPISVASQQMVTVSGQVRTDNGQVIPFGVTVRLETGEGMLVSQVPADASGQFEIENVRKVPQVLTVTAEGFQTFQKTLELERSSNRYIVSVYLSPLAKKKLAPSALPSLTDEKAPKKARSEYEKGLRLLQEHKMSAAQDHFEKAVAEYPCYARAQTDLALTLTAPKERPRGEAALRKAIECDSGFADAYVQLGWFLNGQKRFPESATILQEGLRRSPGAWQFFFQLGVAHYGLREYHKAEEEFLKARSLNSAAPPELYVKLADVYLKEGANDKAYMEMQKYLRAEPGGRFAAKINEIIQRMESAGMVHPTQVQSAQPPPAKP